MSTEHLISILGYENSPGYLKAEDFEHSPSHRYALLQAAEEMGIVGCFGLWTHAVDHRRIYHPITYIAVINDEDVARVHRRVWNQGVVPFLLVVTPTHLVVCDGFKYATDRTLKNRLGELKTCSLNSLADCEWLHSFSAYALQSSIAWRDRTIDITGHVDYRLLENLKGLAGVLTGEPNFLRDQYRVPRLPIELAHALIGRFLYLFFLIDRQILSDKWLLQRNFSIPSGIDESWTRDSFWGLFKHLDDIFNGSIFPISSENVQKIKNGHLNLIHAVMRREDVYADGLASQVRMSFAEFDFSALRIETLSAVYEQFLHSHELSQGTLFGAHYTPPFMADYLLERMETVLPFKLQNRIIDCAAGSGVFLVGAYRRLIEGQLSGRNRTLPLRMLRQILKESIFGIELIADACHVTCFSLYLTLLDYAERRELDTLTSVNSSREEKVFPSLLNENIIHGNFFDAVPEYFLGTFDCVISNPPWKSLQEDIAAAKFYDAATALEMPVGDNQLAELFLWRALKHLLKKDGVGAFLIPSKSLMNPTSYSFRSKFFSETSVRSITDFSNLRHVVFANAVHPPLALIFKNEVPRNDQRIWHYAPLRASQIGSSAKAGRSTRMWTFLVDEAEIQSVPYAKTASKQDIWIEYSLMRPVDRQIIEHLHGMIDTENAISLDKLEDQISYGRGGNPTETGISAKYILTAGKDTNNYQNHLNVKEFDLVHRATKSKLVPLPLEGWAKVKPAYKEKFGGNVVLLARSLKYAGFVKARMAFNQSFIGIYSLKPSKNIQLLKAVAKILQTDYAKYFLMITAPRFLIDRPNIEPATLGRIPLPFKSDRDPLVKILANMDIKDVHQTVCERLGINGPYTGAIEEFLDFRQDFKDGQVPDEALAQLKSGETERYLDTLQATLNGYLGGYGRYEVGFDLAESRGVALIHARYADEGEELNKIPGETESLIDKYLQQGLSPVTASFCVYRDSQSNVVHMIKPLHKMYWTIERAVHESSRLASAVMRSDINERWYCAG